MTKPKTFQEWREVYYFNCPLNEHNVLKSTISDGKFITKINFLGLNENN